MPKSKVEGRLVAVDELPERRRRGKYVRVLEEFVAGGMKYAKYETAAEPSAVAVALRTAARKHDVAVEVSVISGAVYLAKK